MNLENKIFLYETKAVFPSENLAINRVIKDEVINGKYDVVGRAYYHTKGIILGNEESTLDINLNYCKKNNFEVATRLTGGSAILVSDDLNICYSIFASFSRTNLPKDITKIYRLFVLPLAEKLGAVVEGKYYMRIKSGNNSIPFAGHAMLFGKDFMQFDGVVQKTRFDMDILSQAIRLRELRRLDGLNYIVMDGKTYNLNGEQVELESNQLGLLRHEHDELSRTIGLEELGITDGNFVNHFFQILSEIFPNIKKVNSISLDHAQILVYKNKIRKLNKGKRRGLGHCFVDFMEPEPLVSNNLNGI